MDRELYIPIIEGTTRPKRKSIYAARLVEEVGKSIEGIRVELLDPADFNFPYDGNDDENRDLRYTRITEEADAFFIVTLEYNHGYPGTLKRMLDSELKNYIHKPVAFAGVSAQKWGGVRAIEALVHSVREMGMTATFKDVQFPEVDKLFDEEGNLLDHSYIKFVKDSYEELIWMAKVMQWGRENVPGKYHKQEVTP